MGRGVVRLIFTLVVAALIGAAVSAYWWVDRPLTQSAEVVDVLIAPGQSARAIAQTVRDAGVDVNPQLLYWWFRISGQARAMQAGSYEISTGTTPRSLLTKLVNGEQAFRAVTLVEGWTFRQFRAALAKADHLQPDSAQQEASAIMERLGKPGQHPEGRFFPDTYRYHKGASDWVVLKQALAAMDEKLAAAWAQRSSESTLKNSEELLILASIVEKETGSPSDRGMVSSVFHNRLRIGMRLQTDPTVIYGLGEAFDGNLRKVDLQTDTPWNTYTRGGLPPTPIAMPGEAALLAAAQPPASNALYFVAKGDGSSYFSASLDEHNRAVNQYQRNR